MNNKVILVGGDHYNGLALVRLFGKRGLKPFGIIICKDSHHGYLRTSKYWSAVTTISDESEIPRALFDLLQDGEACPVVIPWSDGAAAFIDDHYDLLSKSFILPSIAGTQGMLHSLMDKAKQVSFARNSGLETAHTIEFDLCSSDVGLPDIESPCICKPIVSCEGKKSDICKIDNIGELEQYLGTLRSKGYKRILLQEYLSIDAEYDVEGFVCGADSTYFTVKKIRTWPKVGGSTSYAISVNERMVNEAMERIVCQLKDMGFTGLFDIELFRVGERLVFNEINWRNSAVCFAAVASGVDYPLYWYEASLGRRPSISRPEKYGLHAMCELLDIRNVASGDIRLGKWISQLLNCDSYAYHDSSDLRPLADHLIRSLSRHLRLTGRQ